MNKRNDRKAKWYNMEKPNRKFDRLQFINLAYMMVGFIYVGWIPNLVLKGVTTVLLILFTISVIYEWSSSYSVRIGSIIFEIMIMFILGGMISPGYFWLIFYPAAAIGTLKLKHMAVGLSLFLSFGYIEIAILFFRHPQAWGDYWPMVLSATIAIIGSSFGTRSYTALMRAKDELEKANGKIKRLAQIAERERISQDLHDVMGHQLSMITLKAQLAKRVLERDKNVPRAVSEISDMETAAREALSRVREYIANIRHPDFAEEWNAAISLFQAAGIEVILDQGNDLRMENKAYHTMAMCLRELTTNIVRHSQAKNAGLRIKEIDNTAFLLIADDGIGLQNAISSLKEGKNTGNGINGVLARMATIDGKATFWTNCVPINQTGVVLPFTIPFAKGTAVLLSAPIRLSDEAKSQLEALS